MATGENCFWVQEAEKCLSQAAAVRPTNLQVMRNKVKAAGLLPFISLSQDPPPPTPQNLETHIKDNHMFSRNLYTKIKKNISVFFE